MGWQRRSEDDGPDTLESWTPFLRVARRAREDGVHWTFEPLDFAWIGWVERKRVDERLWAYRHVRTRACVYVDAEGRPFSVRADRAGRLRTRPITTSMAAWSAGLPEDFLDRQPQHNAQHDGWESCEACLEWLDREEALMAPRRRSPKEPAAPRPHLRLVR
jgi:hypothetical protein